MFAENVIDLQKVAGRSLSPAPQQSHEFGIEGREVVFPPVAIGLQIPQDQYRCNYINVKVRVHRYTAGSLAIFHGPRKLANYPLNGQLKEDSELDAA